MNQSPEEVTTPLPLYHGTSTLFIDGIRSKGLGGANPIADWKVLECARELYPVVEKYLGVTEDWHPKIDGFRMMVEQLQGHSNFQHGDTYVSPALSTAARYAISNRYGSELLTYTLEFMRDLQIHFPDRVPAGLRERYPEAIQRLLLPAAPILICVKDVPASSLLTEHGKDPTQLLETLNPADQTCPALFEVLLQQRNFRLIEPVPAANLDVWLINVLRADVFPPEFELLPLHPLQLNP